MKEFDMTDPTNCPYYLLYRVSLTSTSLLKKELAAAGVGDVKPAYLGTLMSLWQEEAIENSTSGRVGTKGGLKLNELGKKAGLEPSTMTGLIDRMERDGLVCRTNDPNDRRAHLISLTEKGLNIHQTAMTVVNETMNDIFEGIPEEEIERTKNFLRQVLINVNK
ncbi:MAG: MarR family transcriptional regulator [bacterium]|nr:MarR family transcriptional regulator [bacterium]